MRRLLYIQNMRLITLPMITLSRFNLLFRITYSNPWPRSSLNFHFFVSGFCRRSLGESQNFVDDEDDEDIFHFYFSFYIDKKWSTKIVRQKLFDKKSTDRESYCKDCTKKEEEADNRILFLKFVLLT